MDSDEDDIDFDPHLDPSAFHALEEDSPSKTKIEVQKEEWEDIVKDAHEFIHPEKSQASEQTKACVFSDESVEKLHLLLQQIMQVDVQLCTTDFSEMPEPTSRSKHAPSKNKTSEAFAKMSFAAFAIFRQFICLFFLLVPLLIQAAQVAAVV